VKPVESVDKEKQCVLFIKGNERYHIVPYILMETFTGNVINRRYLCMTTVITPSAAMYIIHISIDTTR